MAAEACTCLRIDRLALTLLLGTYEDLLSDLQARASGGAPDRSSQHITAAYARACGPPAGLGGNGASATRGLVGRRRGSSPLP